MTTKKWLHTIAFILVLIGGINWLLFAVIPVRPEQDGFDLIQILFGFSDSLVFITYVLIGISAIYLAFVHAKECKICGEK